MATQPEDQQAIQEDDWESSLPLGSFTAKGQDPISFSVESVKESGGNRLVFRARPYRPGVKIDSTGGKETTWTLEILWSDTAHAFDPLVNAGGARQYPDTMLALIEAFRVQETGDLVIPTRGVKRCRAHTYETVESPEQRVAARMTCVFVEDNEDSVDAAAFNAPTIRGSGFLAAQDATFDAEQVGVWDGTIAGLLDTINEYKGILELPGSVLDEVRANGVAIIGTIRNLLTTFSDEGEDALSMFIDPSSSRLARTLNRLMDAISGAVYESGPSVSQPKTASVAYDQDYSIFDIAAIVKQDANKLIQLNAYRIEDPLHIEAGTEVLIFA